MTEYFLITYHHTNRQFQQSFWDCAWDTDLSMNKGGVLNLKEFKEWCYKHQCSEGNITILNIIRLTKEEYELSFL